MKTRILSVLPAAALLVALMLAWAPTVAWADDMVWSFTEGNDPDNKGRSTARLTYGIPETDASQVAGVCEARAGSGLDAASLTLGADIGKLKDGQQVKLRFSGGGFDHSVPGTVTGAGAEVGITGVQLDVANDDPLWQALTEKQAIDYLVPGYSAAKLDLKGGHKKIKEFIAACRAYAEALAPKQTAQAGTNTKAQGGAGVSQKEAFEAAKELGTIEAWEAFLNRFPSGFRADLARAYVKRIGSKAGDAKPAKTAAAPAPAPATPAPASGPKLQLLNLGPGTTPWQNRNTVLATAGNQNVYAASVKGSGLELITYCRGGAGQGLFAVLRESPRGQYPEFETRLQQAMGNAQPYQGGRRIELSFSNGKSFDQITLSGEPASGEMMVSDAGQALSQGQAFQEILGANTMTILAPPFAATFQLTGSRAAICKVFQRCGATNRPECAKYAPRTVRTQPSRQQPAATKRKATKKKATRKKSGCRSGSVWLEGQCVPRSLVTEFCGPGYTRRGSKCVFKHPEPQTQVQPKAQPKPQPKANVPGAAVQILNQIQQQRKCSGGRVRVRGKCKCPGNQVFSGTACVANQARQTAPPPPANIQQTRPQQAAPNAPPAPPPPRPVTTSKCPGGLVPNPQGGCSPPSCGPGQIATPSGCISISDRRLKRDIVPIAKLESGIRLYRFRYLWDETPRVGVMAQDLLADETTRDAVIVTASGFFAVDYSRLGLKMVTLEAWQARGLAAVRAEPPPRP